MQSRFAAGEDDVRSGRRTVAGGWWKEISYLIYDIRCRHFPVRAVVGVAPRATEIAAAEAHENSGGASPEAFALKRVEYLVDFVHQSIIPSILNPLCTITSSI